jgi:hypothetical protein
MPITSASTRARLGPSVSDRSASSGRRCSSAPPGLASDQTVTELFDTASSQPPDPGLGVVSPSALDPPWFPVVSGIPAHLAVGRHEHFQTAFGTDAISWTREGHHGRAVEAGACIEQVFGHGGQGTTVLHLVVEVVR